MAHPGFEARVKALSLRILEDPKNPGNYALRASEYSRHGDWRKADQDFEKAIDLGARLQILTELGLHHRRQGQAGKALAFFDERLTRVEGDILTLRERARLYASLGQRERALTDYQQYFDLAGDRLTPRDILAIVDLMLTHNPASSDTALALIDAGQFRLGATLTLQRRAVEIEKSQGQIEAAITRWQDSEPLARSSPAWRLELAKLYMEKPDLKRAQEHLESLVVAVRRLKPTPARAEISRTAQKLLYRIVVRAQTDAEP